MKIAVLGSGIIGVSTAWWLQQDGHEVVVIDRQPGPAQETTRASGGQVSVSYAEPWASPQAPWRLARWLVKDNAPLWFRPSLDPKQWAWGVRFLTECLPSRFEPNVRALVRLAEFSRSTLQHMRADLNIDYHCVEQGILNFYRDARGMDEAQEMADAMRDLGVERRILNADEVVALEPSLATVREKIAGGDYNADDESGDAYAFTCALAERARMAGAVFRFSTQVTRLRAEGGEIKLVQLIDTDGSYSELAVDAVVVAMGAYSSQLVTPLGIPCHVYPAKGYSATFEITDSDKAPQVSLSDSANKTVYSRFGNALRVAGTAELSGFSRALNTKRCNSIVKQTQELFPSGLDFDNVQFWSGLRPATPSNIPLIGQTKVRNLYLNTGHGTLGWTLGVGSGRALADIIAGRQPEAEFPFLR